MRPTWSPEAVAAWGKTATWGKDDQSSDDWMPAVQHLMDAAAIAGILWDRWLPTNTKRIIEDSLPSKSRDGKSLLMFLAGVHDIGKFTPAFAIQVEQRREHMERKGFTFSSQVAKDRGDAPHGLAGCVVLEGWLERVTSVIPRRSGLGEVVGAHHGRPIEQNNPHGFKNRYHYLLGTGLWERVQDEVLQTMAEVTGADRYLDAWVRNRLTPHAVTLLSGAVVVADWLASNVDYFPYRLDPIEASDRAEVAWSRAMLTPPWRPEPCSDEVAAALISRFPQIPGGQPRPVQAECFRIAREATGPTMIVVQAPMGEGKTEAALLAAEQLAASTGAGGIIVGLPTMATSNAMFGRVSDWLEAVPGADKSTYLAHSKNRLEPAYDDLVRAARVHGIYDECAPPTGPRSSSAIAVTWLTGRRKGVLSNFVVGTIDQILFLALCAKHAPLRHLALAGKVIVIDEVHAADEYMRVYLLRAIEWLAGYGCSIVLLSATLPSSQQDALIQSYRRGLGLDRLDDLPAPAYPGVTAVNDLDVDITPIEGTSGARTITVSTHADDDLALMETLKERLRDGGCAAIIRDTVGRAQATAEAMWSEFGDESVVLVHSRFLACDRAELERDLVRRLGRSGTDRPARLIVVGTQVLEQSLDIDFDLMISDLAPVDLMLQRAGRLHRHTSLNSSRPSRLADPQLLVTGIRSWEGDRPVFDAGVRAVYPQSRLLRTAAALRLAPGSSTDVRLPEDIQPLVETVYAANPAVPESWLEEQLRADDQLAEKIAAAEKGARSFLIGRAPRAGRPMSAWIHPGPDDTETSTGGSSVRDCDDGFEVLLVQRIDNEVHPLPHLEIADRILPTLMDSPDPALSRVLAGCTVRLPIALCAGATGDAVIARLEKSGYEGWKTNPILVGQLVLEIDAESLAEIEGFKVRYDPHLGLIHARLSGER